MKNNEKQWKTMKNNEKQWKAIKNNEKHEKHDKQWKTYGASVGWAKWKTVTKGNIVPFGHPPIT